MCRRTVSTGLGTAVGLLLFALRAPAAADPARAEAGYREPPPAVVRLLTAPRPPEPLLHAASRRVALLYEQPVMSLDALARPRLGLAGRRLDPDTRTTDIGPRIERVEIVEAAIGSQRPPTEWRPGGGALLSHVRFSPDGRRLSAIAVSDGPARLVLFEIEGARERALTAPVNAAWGEPCSWIAADALLCRLVPADLGLAPAQATEPRIVEHRGGPAPTRTYQNLLDNAHEDALFEHYFSSELARVGIDGSLRRIPASRGLIASVLPSPGGALAVVTRVERPFSRLVPARRFPRQVELWDVERGERLRVRPPANTGGAIVPPAREGLRGFTWKRGTPASVGWIEPWNDGAGQRGERWLALDPPYDGAPREIARSDSTIESAGWTTAGTPLFSTRRERGRRMEFFRVTESGPQKVWSGASEDRYGNPGRVLRTNGASGAWLESGGRVFLASDGLGPDGPQPRLDAFDLASLQSERIFTSPAGVFEPVLGILDVAAPPLLVTSRETESEPPNLFVVQGAERTALRPFANPFPELDGSERRIVTYPRADGVRLSGTLYVPAQRRAGERLPTLIWIYPAEFSEAEFAEQGDVRRFRFHRMRGPSPLCVLLGGYALLLSPSMPIIGESGRANDAFVEQLVANAEAAVRHLESSGVADPKRIAIGGRSWGAFSTANLLAHTQLFRTGIALAGAYNRTLTPFGFQRERRSFWKASDVYSRMSPFFFADVIKEPMLLVHGAADENAGTPPEQTRRFFHALVGNGVPARHVELPYEGHHFWARESVLHIAAEMLDWLERMRSENRDAATVVPRRD